MLRLLSLGIQNLFSFEAVSLNFREMDSDIKMMIVGENLDGDAADSNGSGKSSLLESIVFGIFGEPIRNIPVSKVIRTGENFCRVDIELGNEDFGNKGDEYRIVRKRTESNSEVQFYVNGVEQTCRTASLTQKKILHVLGLSDGAEGLEDFLNSVYFTPASFRFVSKDVTSAERMKMLSRLLKLHRLDDCLVVVKDDYKNFDIAIGQLNSKLEVLDSQINDRSLDDLKKKSLEQEKLLQVLSAEIDELELKREVSVQVYNRGKKLLDSRNTLTNLHVDVDKNYRESVDRLIGSEESYTNILLSDKERFELMSLEDYDLQLDKLKNDEEVVKIELNKLTEELRNCTVKKMSIDNEIFGLIDEQNRLQGDVKLVKKCPNCGLSLLVIDNKIERFNLDLVNLELDRLKKEVTIRSSRLVDIEAFLKGFKTKVEDTEIKLRSDLYTAMSEVKSKMKAKEELGNKIFVMEGQLSRISTTIEDLKVEYENKLTELLSKETELVNEIKEFEEDGKQVTEEWLSKVRDMLDDLLEKRAKLKEEKVSKQTELSFLNKEIENLAGLLIDRLVAKQSVEELNNKKLVSEFWIKGFPEIKRRLIQNFLPLFEENVNKFLEKFGSKERVIFSTVKNKRDGSGSFQAFDISIFDGSVIRDFESFSQGERGRIGISVGFAINGLLFRDLGKFGFIVCDEILDVFDDTGIEKFLRLIDGMGGTKFIVSHAKKENFLDKVDGIIKVVKENGISRVEV